METNNKARSLRMLQDAQKVGQTDFTKALLYKFVYRSAAVGWEFGYVSRRISYYDKNNHYLAIKVDDKVMQPLMIRTWWTSTNRFEANQMKLIKAKFE